MLRQASSVFWLAFLISLEISTIKHCSSSVPHSLSFSLFVSFDRHRHTQTDRQRKKMLFRINHIDIPWTQTMDVLLCDYYPRSSLVVIWILSFTLAAFLSNANFVDQWSLSTHVYIHPHMHRLWNLCTLPTKIDFVTQVQSSSLSVMMRMIRERKKAICSCSSISLSNACSNEWSTWATFKMRRERDRKSNGQPFLRARPIFLSHADSDRQDVCQNAYTLNLPDEFWLVKAFSRWFYSGRTDDTEEEREKRDDVSRSAIGKWRNKKVERTREKKIQGTLIEVKRKKKKKTSEDEIGVSALLN